MRGRFLRELRAGPDPRALDRLFAADSLWGVAAALWLVTGIVRSAADLKPPIGSDSRCPPASRSQPLASDPWSPLSEPKGWLTVKTLKFWLSPAVLVAVWIIAAAFTLSQLATVGPSLLSTGL